MKNKKKPRDGLEWTILIIDAIGLLGWCILGYLTISVIYSLWNH